MTNQVKQGEDPKDISAKGAGSSKGSSKKGLIGQGGGSQGDRDPKGSEAHKGSMKEERDPEGSQIAMTPAGNKVDKGMGKTQDPKGSQGIIPEQGLFTQAIAYLTPITPITPGKRKDRSGSSEENSFEKPSKAAHLSATYFGAKDLDISFSSIELSDDYDKEGDGDFIKVTRKNRGIHSSPKNATAFEEQIINPTPTPTKSKSWTTEPLQYVYVMYTFVKNIGDNKILEYTKGLSNHKQNPRIHKGTVEPYRRIHHRLPPPSQSHGPYFQMDQHKANKAIHYDHPGIEIKYVTQSNSPPSAKTNVNTQPDNQRSYATLNINTKQKTEMLGKLFDFKRYSIVGAMWINDKNSKPTNQVKLTFSMATPPTELTDNMEAGFT